MQNSCIKSRLIIVEEQSGRGAGWQEQSLNLGMKKTKHEDKLWRDGQKRDTEISFKCIDFVFLFCWELEPGTNEKL